MYLQVPEGSTIAIFSQGCVSECQATSTLLTLQKMADEEAWRHGGREEERKGGSLREGRRVGGRVVLPQRWSSSLPALW